MREKSDRTGEALRLCVEIHDEARRIRCNLEEMNRAAVDMKLQVLVMENRLLALPGQLSESLVAAAEAAWRPSKRP